MTAFIFYVFAATVLVSALCVVLLRNVLHSALFLGLALAGVAGIFASLSADFLFAAQILIYVGGIAVLILFVVLLAARSSELRARQVNQQWLAGAVVCGLILYGLCRYLGRFGRPAAAGPAHPTTLGLGRLLLGDQAIPFELVSLILMAALAGAVLFSKPEKSE